MPHAVSSHFGLNDFHTAFFANHAAVLHPFVLAAVTLVVFGGPEYFCTKQSVPFRFKRPVIDGLGLFNFTM